jgi:hypothetical protein
MVKTATVPLKSTPVALRESHISDMKSGIAMVSSIGDVRYVHNIPLDAVNRPGLAGE